MKCPECKTEGFSTVYYKETGMKIKPSVAIMECKECKHREYFR